MRFGSAWGTIPLWIAAALAVAAAAGTAVDISVLDSANHPVAGVKVAVKLGGQPVASAETGPDGHAQFADLPSAKYEISATKDGFEPLQKGDLEITGTSAIAIELTLVPSLARREQVEVHGTAEPVAQGSSGSTELQPQQVKEIPSRPATVADVLPMIPGVVRAPDGALNISAAGEHRSALIVNSADVTDPATGQFGLTVPIDSVERLEVFQTPFLAQYGRFTEGLVSVETRRGGEQWKWELNDPFPDFRIRSYQLRGVRDATPRLNFEGPLIARRLYISEGFEYEIRKTEVYTLPFPLNQKKEEGLNSFTQLDWIASSKQLLTATVHLAPQRLAYVNMNYFNPEQTAPDAGTHNYTATLADRLTLWGGVLENTVSETRFDARVWGQGPQDLVITPWGNSGNYFAQQNRDATRLGWSPTYSVVPLTGWGTHELKAGAYFARSTDHGLVQEHPIDLLDGAGQLFERLTFTPGRTYQLSDEEYAAFAQDHWLISPHLAVDLGVRTESQEVSSSFRVAPRAGIAWTPFGKIGTVIRTGFGWFYDRVPLSIYSFNRYPHPVVTMFDPGGDVSAGPFEYDPGLSQVTQRFSFVFHKPVPGNFSPRSATGSFQVEQPLGQRLKLRVGYLQNDADGLVILDTAPPDPITNRGAYSLSGAGQSRYHQIEVTARVRVATERELYFSYVRSQARGDLNDFASFLGSFPAPLVRPNQFGNLPADLPNRFLAWGVMKLPAGFRISPVFEYRSGFPYAVIDGSQSYVGIPNQNRYPNFISLDSRFSKDVKVNSSYTVRFSIAGFNLGNHFNPEALHYNVADPAYGLFFGQRGRRFTADFDVLF
jgi:hypothetical protein